MAYIHRRFLQIERNQVSSHEYQKRFIVEVKCLQTADTSINKYGTAWNTIQKLGKEVSEVKKVLKYINTAYIANEMYTILKQSHS